MEHGGVSIRALIGFGLIPKAPSDHDTLIKIRLSETAARHNEVFERALTLLIGRAPIGSLELVPLQSIRMPFVMTIRGANLTRG